MRYKDWDRKLLLVIAGDVRPEPLRFLRAWQACEGGTARFNPLNTTMSVPGATPYNSAGVKHYPDELAGLAATLLTIRLPYYKHIIAGLRSKSLTAEQILAASRVDLATWGTGSNCILESLRH